jgi:uncharacterized protein (TIGR02231 family)
VSDARDEGTRPGETGVSRAVKVTLFEDRAEVVRAAHVEIAAGTSWVSLDGVSPFVDERSVQARLTGEAAEGVKVLSARVRWRTHLERALGREEIDALVQKERAAQRVVREQDLAIDRATRAEEQARQLLGKWLEGVAQVPRGAREPAALASFGAALAAVQQRAAQALAQIAGAREARQQAADELGAARARLQAGRVERPRHEAVIEVQLGSSEARRIGVELSYRVPCALWRPEHVVRLAAMPKAGKAAPLSIVTMATAWQRTGERWDEVELCFSTARPARVASPPLLSDDLLHARRKTDQERQRVEVDLREEVVKSAGLDRGARVVEEMPGVDDGGEPVLLAAREKVSIPSDGRPFRVEVQQVTVEAQIDRVLFAELSQVAHLRATATLSKGGPLLAGPVRIVRGRSLVGRGRVDYVGKGEPFELGLGTDDGVRVRRVVSEQRDTTAITGTQKIKRQVKIYVSNLGSAQKRLLVSERVPVSEIADVEVLLPEGTGFERKGKDGFLERELSLGPGAVETVELAYEIRAGSKVVLPS